MVVSVIGAGVMGSAIARALIQSGIEKQVIAAEKQAEKLADLKKEGAAVMTDNKKAAASANVVILCVKPNDVGSVLTEIKDEVKGKLVVSIAAAVTLGMLKSFAPEAKFVRAMPNIAALVGEAFIAYSVEPNVTDQDKMTAERLLGTLGKLVEVKEEKMDAITALSGCAPGYLGFVIEAAAQAGVEAGLSKELALAALAQSMVGTGRLMLEQQKSPDDIKRLVATPGGVTEEELKKLEEHEVDKAFVASIRSGVAKSRRISQSLVRDLGKS
jgi:pyrroline-5-carboxylate reductase